MHFMFYKLDAIYSLLDKGRRITITPVLPGLQLKSWVMIQQLMISVYIWNYVRRQR